MDSQAAPEVLFKGSCFCKAISFIITALPFGSYICHCQDCRRFTGSSFAHNAPFSDSSVLYTLSKPEDSSFASPDPGLDEPGRQGADLPKRTYNDAVTPSANFGKPVSAFDLQEGSMATYGSPENGMVKFCSLCGTRVALTCGLGNESMRDTVIVPIGTIDGSEADDRLKPTSEVFCRRRETWMSAMEGTNSSE